MKLYLSVLLVIGIISCLCLAAPATDDEDYDGGGISGRGLKIDIHECTGQYLKSKGLLASDVPIGNSPPSMCRALLRGVVPTARMRFENKAKEKLPNEVDCLMTEFDKGEIVDFIHKLGFYETDVSLSAAERDTVTASLTTEALTFLNTMASVCGIEEDRFQPFLLVLPSHSKTGKVSETVKSD